MLGMDMSPQTFSPRTRREIMELSGNLLFSPKSAALAAVSAEDIGRADVGISEASFLAKVGNSPRVGPFHASPYRLRSAGASPLVGFACHAARANVVYDAGLANKSSKRKLHMAESHSVSGGVTPVAAAAAEAMHTQGGASATMPSAAVALTSSQSSGSSSAKKKEKRDKRTAAAPKRGEYKCGKCGYFPKKEKHNCDLERNKRIANGTFQDKSGKDAKRHMGGGSPYMHGMHGATLSHGGYPMAMGDPMLGYPSMPSQQQQQQQHGQQRPYAFHHMGNMGHMQQHGGQHPSMSASAQLQPVRMGHPSAGGSGPHA